MREHLRKRNGKVRKQAKDERSNTSNCCCGSNQISIDSW